MPPTSERIMIYVKQESEEAFTGTNHLQSPKITQIHLKITQIHLKITQVT